MGGLSHYYQWLVIALPQELCLLFFQSFLLSNLMLVRDVIIHQPTWEASVSHHQRSDPSPPHLLISLISSILSPAHLPLSDLNIPLMLHSGFYCVTAGDAGTTPSENWFPGLVLGNVRKCTLSLDPPIPFIHLSAIECFNSK